MENVKAALRGAGLNVTATHSRSVRVAGDAMHVSSLLGANLSTVKAPSGSTRMVATTTPSLPAALQAEGAKIVAFNAIPPRRPAAVKGPLAPIPANRYTNAGTYWFTDLKQAYSYPAYSKTTQNKVVLSDGGGVKVAVLMADLIFPGDVAAAFDHEQFTTITGKPAPTVGTVLVDGGGVYNGPGSFEASLDVQQVTGGAPGANVTLISIPNLSDQSVIDAYTSIVDSNAYDIVNSSFGGCELFYTAAYNGGVDYTFILQAEHEIYEQGNAQGITFVASSGDEGGLQCPGVDYFSGFNSVFVASVSSPADDPNVTAVGGGNLVTSVGPGLNSTYVRESAYGDPRYPYDPYGLGPTVSGGYWGAGGGVSAIFGKPLYQYLANTGSRRGRAVPDVGMQVGGLGFSNSGCDPSAISCSPDDSSVVTAFGVGLGGGFYYTIGTSVSSPEFVGALALFEQRAHRQGNLNFLLYLAGAAQTAAGGVNAPAKQQYFHRGMQGFDGVYAAGFPTANYDYIYGNGSPDVANLFGLNSFGLAGTPQTPSNP
jgi:subtilase family serine protease